MSERPILFSGEMVRAILEGRKTQTRRVVKPQPVKYLDGWKHWDKLGGFYSPCNKAAAMKKVLMRDCPYGQPGGRLWVRETLQYGARNNPAPRHNHLWRYAADNAPVMVSEAKHTEMLVWATHKEGDVCVSIHMPRWASRITLEIADVRVERIQDISEEEALAEGVTIEERTQADIEELPEGDIKELARALGPGHLTARFNYQFLWDEINEKRGFGWDVNPWVWVITFKTSTGGISG